MIEYYFILFFFLQNFLLTNAGGSTLPIAFDTGNEFDPPGNSDGTHFTTSVCLECVSFTISGETFCCLN